MSSTILSLICNMSVALLLIATILYCSKLSKRIKMLQDGRSEFASMLTQFDTATNRAVASVTELQTISKRITDALQLKIDKANFLADDLAFLIEKSNKLLLQIEQQTKHVSTKAQELKPSSEIKPTPRPTEARAPQASITPLSQVAKSRQYMENVLQILSESSASSEANVVPRTNAERELLAALKLNR